MRIHEPLPILMLSLAATFSAAASATPPATPERSGVAVVNHPPRIIVRVSRPTELAAVLEDLCQELRANCRVASGVVSGAVAPTTVSGTWLEVMAGLLKETGISYAATPAVPGLPAQLVIDRQAPLKSAGDAGPDGRATAPDDAPATNSVQRAASDPSTGLSTGPNEMDSAEEETEPQGSEFVGLAGVSVDFPPNTLESSVGATAVSVNSAAGTPPVSASGVGPFPGWNAGPGGVDSNGGSPPVAASPVGAPFPDPSGNPLAMAPPAAPGAPAPTGVPFPDPQGNPFPMSLPGGGAGQPSGLNPFPDPHGAPIVSPTPPPGQDHD